MTDEQVKKGLECCESIGICGKGCPYKELDCCNSELLKDALALINRLEEQVADLELKNESLKLLDRITVSWEVTKKDSPIVCIFYQDKDGKVYMLRGSYDESGVANIGREYRTCFNNMKQWKKEESDYAENPQI